MARLKQIGWFIALWALSIMAVGAVSMLLRFWLTK